MFPPFFSAGGVYLGFYSSASLFFMCTILCDILAKKRSLSKASSLLKLNAVPGKLSILPRAIKTRNFCSEISKPKRHSVNYSPSLHQSGNLIMTGGCYRGQNRGSNSNMFAAKKYGSAWCVRRLQGTRMNGNNSSGENAACFMSHSLEMKKTRKLLVSFFCEWHQWSFCFPN